HTPGSTCFTVGNLLFSGDTLFPGGVGNTKGRTGHFFTIIRSVEYRLFALPDDTIIYPGHGNPSTIGTERPSLPEWKERGWEPEESVDRSQESVGDTRVPLRGLLTVPLRRRADRQPDPRGDRDPPGARPGGSDRRSKPSPPDPLPRARERGSRQFVSPSPAHG